MTAHGPLLPARPTEPGIATIIDDARRRVPDASADGLARGRAERVLNSLHGFMLGLTTVLLAIPTVLAVIVVTMVPIIVWLLLATLLQITFRLVASLTGARPETVAPRAFHRTRLARDTPRAHGGVG